MDVNRLTLSVAGSLLTLSLTLLFLLLVPNPTVSANEKVIVMGYKSIAKPPLIGDQTDNSGLYYDLFSQAAERIGYTLQVVRIPKKRLHYELAIGNVDFYPGSSFSTKRADYLYYLPNGLKTKEVLISLQSFSEITDMHHAQGKLIVELGSSKIEWDQLYPGLTIIQMGKLSMERVIKALKEKRGDFYIADIEIVEHYQKQHNLQSYDEIGVRIHHFAINKQFIPMNMGFSRKSKLFSESPNPEYQAEQGVSIHNFYTQVNKNSTAYAFYLALDQLDKEGVTQSLYEHYFRLSPDSD